MLKVIQATHTSSVNLIS